MEKRKWGKSPESLEEIPPHEILKSEQQVCPLPSHSYGTYNCEPALAEVLTQSAMM